MREPRIVVHRLLLPDARQSTDTKLFMIRTNHERHRYSEGASNSAKIANGGIKANTKSALAITLVPGFHSRIDRRNSSKSPPRNRRGPYCESQSGTSIEEVQTGVLIGFCFLAATDNFRQRDTTGKDYMVHHSKSYTRGQRRPVTATRHSHSLWCKNTRKL